ncbi:two-component system nitrate/nitrite response regulator NarL [Streptomyces achromogenes]|uniref:Two-component system nitrate/nitrite response regulator NarL n=2 Tax=Streptomyces achromogenes TaxID=67255 RepID=A0ABU0PUN8_STRAH|nr:two-component system nitrate/nitrite response regulator NarL [Streptomyces achromogenes]
MEMTSRSTENGRVLLYEPEACDVSVLLADADPVSRHVLATALDGADRITVLDTADSGRPLHRWPLDGVDVVVLADAFRPRPASLVPGLVHKGVRVLLLDTRWTARTVGDALAAGCAGVLVKDPEIGRLAAAVRAAAAGYVVVSPELVGLCPPARRTATPAPARPRGDRSAGRRLRSLTEREREVLTVLAAGLSTREAAGRLEVTPATVKSHVSHALAKLSVRNRLEAVLLMRQALDEDRPPWS